MDYEKKYKEALAWIRSIYSTMKGATREDAEHYFLELKESENKEKPNGGIVLEDFTEGDGFYKVNLAYLSKEQVEEIETIVKKWNPELKESEDEKIIKGIIKYLEQSQFGEEHYCVDDDIVRDYITWLEKQGEQKPAKNIIEKWKDMRFEIYQQASGNRHEPNCSDGTTKMFSLNDIDEIIEKMSEQNPADKAESKSDIEKDKWYVCNTPRYTDFIIGKAYYCPKNGMLKPNETEMARYVAKHCFHLWTIQDAKDGDVLTTDMCTFIFKHECDGDAFMHCGYSLANNMFYVSDTSTVNVQYVHPATKEQRDILFQKMKKAGYEWDAERKEVKKIEQKPNSQFTPEQANVLDNHVDNFLGQKPTWSKEDESLYNYLHDELNASLKDYCGASLDDMTKAIKWFESIRDKFK